MGLVSFCPPSLVSHAVCLWTKGTIKEEKSVSELRSCVNREGAWTLISYPIFPPSVVSQTVSVDVKHHERRTRESAALSDISGGDSGRRWRRSRTPDTTQAGRLMAQFVVTACCLSPNKLAQDSTCL